jgi:hypothetical protein
MDYMKTTVEIPDSVFRRAKSAAGARGIPLRVFVTEAVRDKIAAETKAGDKPWLKHMGKLKHLHKETVRDCLGLLFRCRAAVAIGLSDLGRNGGKSHLRFAA